MNSDEFEFISNYKLHFHPLFSDRIRKFIKNQGLANPYVTREYTANVLKIRLAASEKAFVI